MDEVARRTGKVLRESGFKGSGRRFYRDCGEVWQAIDFQQMPWRPTPDTPVTFTCNLYLKFPRLDRRGLPEYPETTDIRRLGSRFADQSLQVGDVSQANKGGWRDIEPNSLESVWTEFEAELRRSVIPAFDQMRSQQGVSRILSGLPAAMQTVFTRRWLGPFATPGVELSPEERARQSSEIAQSLKESGFFTINPTEPGELKAAMQAAKAVQAARKQKK